MSEGQRCRVSRDDIAAAAWALFEENGYDATTMTEVAERAGVSRRTLFNHFEQKAALLYRGTDEFMDQFLARLGSRPHDEPLFAALTGTFRGLVGVAAAQEEKYRPGPHVAEARGRDDVTAFWKAVWGRQIADVVTATRGPQSRLKANLIGALVGQIWTELSRMEQEDAAADKAQAALAVLGELEELVYG